MKTVSDELALILQPTIREENGVESRTSFSELCAEKAEAHKKVSDADRKALFFAASKGDPAAKSELSGAMIEEVNINVLGQLFAMSFFRTKTYGPADFPVIRTELYDKNFFVTSIGLNGGNPMKQHVEAMTDYLLNFGYWATPAFEFQQYHLQTGPLNYFGKALARVTYELGLKLDQIARDFLRANAYLNSAVSGTSTLGFGSIAGNAAALTTLLNLHASINSDNIPPANGLDMSAFATGKLSMEKIKRILDYTVRWTQDVQPQEGGGLAGPMEVRALHVSSQRWRDLWDQADMVALVATAVTGEPYTPNTAPTATIPAEGRNAIWRSGKIDTFFGHACPIVPNNTLSSNEAYVAFNRPAGEFHSKPFFDSTVHDQTPELSQKNSERVWMKKCGVFHMTNDTIPNFLQIKL